MNRKIVAVWVSLAIVLGFIVVVNISLNFIPTVKGDRLNVNTTGSGGAFTSIQDAINASGDGDTVFVYNGTYYEHVVVNRKVKLTGQDRYTTIINGTLSGTVVSVEADDVRISNFTITDSGWDEKYGIKGYEYGSGIVIHSQRNVVEGCNFQNIQKMPIYFPDSSDQNLILNNTFTGEYMNGMRFDGREFNKILIRNNTFMGPLYGIVTYGTGNFNDAIIEGNYFYGSGWIGISLRSGNRVIIKENYIEGYETGIRLYRTSDSIVFSNTLFNNSEKGILVEDSSNNLIYHNNFINNTDQTSDDGDNSWNMEYPTGGNYWSDYIGEDKYSGQYQDEPENDGIGDRQYIFDTDNIDRYPMMNQCEPITTTPSQVLNLMAIPQDTLVNLTWSPPHFNGDTPIINYRIYRGSSRDQETLLVELGDLLHYDDTDVTNGNTYFYTVSTVNLIGEGPESEAVSAMPFSVPSEPLNLVADAGDSYVNLMWQVPHDNGGLPITNYRIHRGFAPGFEVYLTTIGDVTFFNDTSVENKRTYHYRITAENSVGESEMSNGVAGTLDYAQITSDPPPPSNPKIPWVFWIIALANAVFLIVFLIWFRFKKISDD